MGCVTNARGGIAGSDYLASFSNRVLSSSSVRGRMIVRWLVGADRDEGCCEVWLSGSVAAMRMTVASLGLLLL